ncbi:MAG: sulfite exporter TauE/SafE family protein, partial [Candidatus Omnitrophica bacterium]|nr:sulfite exporter TauE/SafE family protein [Candidatus Omnitrophota bacterium]
IIIFNLNKKYNFSWRKVTALGLIASFNKGISGGGYGPLITGGQILVGVESKSAIGITSLAEGLTCAVGVITYISASQSSISWKLAPYVILGAILSVPFSAKSLKIIDARKLKLAIALLTIFLGIFTLVKLYKF